MDDQQKLVEATPEGTEISIEILEQNESEIYVCVQAPGERAARGSVQRVLLLRLKSRNGLLRSRASWREFSGCPVLGGDGPDSSAGS
jgi:hypothetical protein